MDAAVSRAGDDQIVASEGAAADRRIGGELGKARAGFEILQPQCMVIGAREGAASVGQHRHRADPISVPF